MSQLLSIFAKYEDVGMVGDNWGRAGSGFLFTTGDAILLLKRSPYVMEPGTWGIPGGAIPEIRGRLMNPKASALKEVREEIGAVPKKRIIDKYVYSKRKFTYTTFIAKVSKQFKPKLNWEHSSYKWFFKQDLAGVKLHPGVRNLLRNVDPFSSI